MYRSSNKFLITFPFPDGRRRKRNVRSMNFQKVVAGDCDETAAAALHAGRRHLERTCAGARA